MAINIKMINLFVEDLRKKSQIGEKIEIDDLINLVEKLKGKVRFEKMSLDIDGKIKRNNDGFIIILNKNTLNEKKIKFTLAHKLGHLFIHMNFLDPIKWKNEDEFIDSTFYRKCYSIEEYEANLFAAFLLMSEKEFKRQAINFSFDNKCNIIKLSDYFGVPIKEVLTRGKWLGIFECN